MHLFLNYILPLVIAAGFLTGEFFLLRRIRNKNRKEMTVAIDTLSTITNSKKVDVSSFEGTVSEVDSFNGTVKVRDLNGNVHYLDISQVTKVLPFEDGAVYIDSYNDKYTWQAAVRGWLNSNGRARDFTYPVRPLRKFTLSETQFSD